MKKKTVKKLKPLSPQEHYELAANVDNESFFYYMAFYGPDMKAIERLGFDPKEVKNAVNYLVKVEEKISKGLDYEDCAEDF